jgi:hypothetical protein
MLLPQPACLPASGTIQHRHVTCCRNEGDYHRAAWRWDNITDVLRCPQDLHRVCTAARTSTHSPAH